MLLLKSIIIIELFLAWLWFVPMLFIGTQGWELAYISLLSLPLNIPLILVALYQFVKHPSRRKFAATAFGIPLISFLTTVILRWGFNGPVAKLSPSTINHLLFTFPILIVTALGFIICLCFPRKLLSAVPKKLSNNKTLLICLLIFLCATAVLGVTISSYLFLGGIKQSSAVAFGALLVCLGSFTLFFIGSSLLSYVGLFTPKTDPHRGYRIALFTISILGLILFSSPLLLLGLKS